MLAYTVLTTPGWIFANRSDARESVSLSHLQKRELLWKEAETCLSILGLAS